MLHACTHQRVQDPHEAGASAARDVAEAALHERRLHAVGLACHPNHPRESSAVLCNLHHFRLGHAERLRPSSSGCVRLDDGAKQRWLDVAGVVSRSQPTARSCVCVYVMCGSACVRACVLACVSVHVRVVCVCARARVRACVRVCENCALRESVAREFMRAGRIWRTSSARGKTWQCPVPAR